MRRRIHNCNFGSALLVAFLVLATAGQVTCQGRRSNPPTTPEITSVSFVGVDIVWLTTFREGKILRTQDAGDTWSDISIKDVRVDGVAFIDERKGWAISADGNVWKTIDAGTSWTHIGSIPETSEFHYAGARQFYFANETEGWMIDAFALWCTVDGGANWTRCFPSTPPALGEGSPMSYFRGDAKAAWIGTTDGEVCRTTDGGRSWQRRKIATDAAFNGLFFIDEKTGWAGGWPNGGIYRTSDGGDTWTLQIAQTPLNSIAIDSLFFLNKDDGWAVGRVWPPNPARGNPRSLVLHTVDGGQNWNPVNIGTDELFFTKVHFSGAKRGWIIGRETVYRSDDGGSSWRRVLASPRIK